MDLREDAGEDETRFLKSKRYSDMGHLQVPTGDMKGLEFKPPIGRRIKERREEEKRKKRGKRKEKEKRKED